jgi:hypothetical protein
VECSSCSRVSRAPRPAVGARPKRPQRSVTGASTHSSGTIIISTMCCSIAWRNGPCRRSPVHRWSSGPAARSQPARTPAATTANLSPRRLSRTTLATYSAAASPATSATERPGRRRTHSYRQPGGGGEIQGASATGSTSVPEVGGADRLNATARPIVAPITMTSTAASRRNRRGRSGS